MPTPKRFPQTHATRWTEPLAKRYTPIAKVFIEYACRKSGRKDGGLGLSPVQAMIIAQLIDYKRDERMPYPGNKTLATRLGVSETTIRNNLATIARKKLLVKYHRQGETTLYDLTPLFERLEELEVMASERKALEMARREAERLPETYNKLATERAPQ